MLRPIDVQQVVMQMEQAEKVQRVEQHRPEMQQRYLAQQAKAEKKLRQEKVTDAEETRKTFIRDRRERERRTGTGLREGEPERRVNANRRQSLRQVSREEEDQDVAPQGGHINIKV